MDIQVEPRRTIVFVSIVDPEHPFGNLSKRRQALLTSTTEKLRETISIAKIFRAETTDATQAAELMQKIYNWDMEIEGSKFLGTATTRLLINVDAYKIKEVLSDRYDNSSSPHKAVICIAEQAAITGALVRLTGSGVPAEMTELNPGEALIVHFYTNKWSDLNPFTYKDAELVRPGSASSPQHHRELDLV